ncbi:ArnT family glycosyltransferase [Devosia enhydra]|nr:glycosyltransferase family 39 protein [Devosia enhydra]
MAQNVTRAAFRPPLPIVWLKLAAGLLILGKLYLMAMAGPFMDEAYYWMWGQHPALSYYDHPPLNAWMQGLAGALFGWNRFSLRIMVGLALVADIAILWIFARRLGGAAKEGVFWTTLVLLLATPIYVAVTAVALPDHLMLTFGLASLLFFHAYLADWRVDRPTPERDLFIAALLLGLAVLSKYNGAFIGFGVLAAIVFIPRLRPLLRRWQTYAAAALALLVQWPVLAWNMENGFASFGFILAGRHEGLAQRADGVVPFLISILVFLSPFALWPIGKFLAKAGLAKGEGVARAIVVVSTLGILAVSLVTTALFHWNLPAYLALLPFLAFHFRPAWLYAAHLLYGSALLLGLIVNYTIMPIGDVRQIRDEASAWVYGWEETADRVAALRAEHGAGFVATPDYTTAALLGYAMADPSVTSLSPRRDQFDFWFDDALHKGTDAILLADNWRPLRPEIEALFETLERLETREVERFGKWLNTHTLYLARGYRGEE